MSEDGKDRLAEILKRLGEHGEALARHEVEIQALRDVEERLQKLLGDLREDTRDAKQELKSEMTERFDRLAASVERLGEQSAHAVPPELAEDLAATRAAESRARAYALALLTALVAAVGVIAALMTH